MNREAARRALAAAALVGMIAFVIHATVVISLPDDPYTTTLVSDAQSYDQWARRIATSGIPAEPVFHQSPLYPVVLAAAYGDVPPVDVPERVWWLQAAVNSFAVACVVWFGAAYLGSLRAGLFGAALAILFGPIVFHGVKLLPVALALATQAAALALLARYRRAPAAGWAVAAGLACGVACTARAEFLLFVPIAAAAVAGAAPAGRRAAHAAVVVMAAAAAIAPVTAHNLGKGDRVLIASSAGENLYAGNRIGADGGHTAIDPRAGDIDSSRIVARRIASEALGRDARPSEVSAFWRDRALREILEDPGSWIVLEFRKLGRALHPGDPSDLYSFPLERDLYLPALRLLPVPASVVVLLGAIGLVMAWRTRRRSAWPLVAYVAVQLFVLLAFFVSARLRIPFLFGLTPFGGLAIAWALDRWRAPDARRAVVLLAVATMAAAAVGWMMTSPAPRDRVRLAAVLSSRGDLGEALDVLRPLTDDAAKPDALALDQQGWVLSKRGDNADAIESYRAALAAGLPPGREASTRFRLAELLAGRGRRDEAAEELRRAVELEPAWEEPRRALEALGYRGR